MNQIDARHDIDDAIRAGLLDPGDIPGEYVQAFGPTTSKRINAFICDLVDFNWQIPANAATWVALAGAGLRAALDRPPPAP